MEKLMILPGSFHSAGYAGELDTRTRREMRKSMALREDVFSAMLLFLSRILIIREHASQEMVAAVLLEFELMARLVLCPEEAEDYRVGGVRLVEEEFCTIVGDGEVSHGVSVPGVELQVFAEKDLCWSLRRGEMSCQAHGLTIGGITNSLLYDYFKRRSREYFLCERWRVTSSLLSGWIQWLKGPAGGFCILRRR
jgi:hypothetical protein